jgi:hypothetical protein
MASMHQRQPRAVPQVATHLMRPFVIVEHLVELNEYRVRLPGSFWHTRKHVFGLRAINQHARRSKK